MMLRSLVTLITAHVSHYQEAQSIYNVVSSLSNNSIFSKLILSTLLHLNGVCELLNRLFILMPLY